MFLFVYEHLFRGYLESYAAAYLSGGKHTEQQPLSYNQYANSKWKAEDMSISQKVLVFSKRWYRFQKKLTGDKALRRLMWGGFFLPLPTLLLSKGPGQWVKCTGWSWAWYIQSVPLPICAWLPQGSWSARGALSLWSFAILHNFKVMGALLGFSWSKNNRNILVMLFKKHNRMHLKYMFEGRCCIWTQSSER